MSESSAGNAQLDLLDSAVLEETFGPLDDLKLEATKAPMEGLKPGATKYDGGKARMELLPLPTMEKVAEVMTFGAAKYADNGWKSLPNAEGRYTGAMLRHLAAIERGEKVDPESGLRHIYHVACNALFLAHFELERANGK